MLQLVCKTYTYIPQKSQNPLIYFFLVATYLCAVSFGYVLINQMSGAVRSVCANIIVTSA